MGRAKDMAGTGSVGSGGGRWGCLIGMRGGLTKWGRPVPGAERRVVGREGLIEERV